MNNIPCYEDMYAGTYFSPEDFGPGEQLVVTITAHEAMELTVRGKGKNWKMVLTVADQMKKVAVNKTSWKRLVLAWGKDFDAWIGGQIRLERGEVNGKSATLCTPLPRKKPDGSKLRGVAEIVRPTVDRRTTEENGRQAAPQQASAATSEPLEIVEEFIEASARPDGTVVMTGKTACFECSPDLLTAAGWKKGHRKFAIDYVIDGQINRVVNIEAAL